MAYTTINKHTDYFNTKLYTGNETDNHAITGVGFQPDFTWIKTRGTVKHHAIFDAVRGATKYLQSNTTAVEGTEAISLKSFDSDGFTLGTGATLAVVNQSTTMASWNWKANGAGSSNTDGTITSTVSANQTAGFSIVKWTGTGANATVGHGLGSAPKVIIIKGLSTTYDWVYGSDDIAWTNYLTLNTTNASNSGSSVWNNTDPTSSVFSVGSNLATNSSSVEHIAYCFAEKKGFSKFGAYSGDGSTDGIFIYLGFRPSFFLVKNTATTEDWMLYDNKRDANNVMQTRLRPNRNIADTTNTDYYVDFLSNGIKLRAVNSAFNGSGNTMIYMAFGQSLVGSNNVPCTAR